MTDSEVPQGNQDGLICDNCYTDAEEQDTACWNCGHTTFVYEPGNRRPSSGSQDSIDKPPVNEIAAIIYDELFNNLGMTIAGKVERIIPRIEAWHNTQLKAAIPEKKNTWDFDPELTTDEKIAKANGYNHAIDDVQANLEKGDG